ncbi:MAG: tellurite resistance TerB family protein [Pseudomonadota bacterium]
MSLVKTLAKVAIGVAVAKGVGSMVQGGQTRGGRQADGGLFGGAHSPNTGTAGGGLEDLLGQVLGGGGTPGAGQGGLGGLLDGLSQMSQPGAATAGTGGGLDDLLGGLSKQMGGLPGGASGGLGGLIGALGGALAGGGSTGGFAENLNKAMREPEASLKTTNDQEAAAALMLKAMIQAAKSDGKFDEGEQEKILERLGDISAEERAFLQRELKAPVDIEGLARETPRAMAPQVYAMSVMGIDLDSQAEAQYLHTFGQALGLDQNTMNAIHQQMGAPVLYS